MGCKKKEEKKEPAPVVPTGPVAPTDPEAAQGFALGEEIGRAYLAMVEELAALVASKPDPASVQGSVEALKAKYIDIFIPLGRRRETLTPKGKGAVLNGQQSYDLKASEKMMTVVNPTMGYYRKKDAPAGGKALSEVMQSMSMLTVYADFPALKRMKPDEAARLDIK
jgi:hypothetical protein